MRMEDKGLNLTVRFSISFRVCLESWENWGWKKRDSAKIAAWLLPRETLLSRRKGEEP